MTTFREMIEENIDNLALDDKLSIKELKELRSWAHQIKDGDVTPLADLMLENRCHRYIISWFVYLHGGDYTVRNYSTTEIDGTILNQEILGSGEIRLFVTKKNKKGEELIIGALRN